MDFGTALEGLKDGYSAKRTGWGGQTAVWLELIPGEYNGPARLWLTSAKGYLKVWEPTQTDLLADDWDVL